MILRQSLLLFAAIILFSCGSSPEKKEEPARKSFFPLASILNDQWKSIDSFHLPVMKLVTVAGKTDSTTSSLSELKQAANELLSPDITQAPLSSKYTENSFADQTIPSITLTYSSQDKSLEVQRLDVLLKPDPVASDKLRNIYMEKNEIIDGISVSKKILLIAESSLQVITTKDSTVNIVKFTWEGLK